MTDYNAQYRDTVFCDYFNDPTRLLSLCNAILGTDYTDASKVNINTLKGIFFNKQKNDISCTIGNRFLVLIEHQTTINENMPFRCLSYVTEILNNLVEDRNRLYHEELIKFPAPEFFVLYNGDKYEPLQREMRLSNAFRDASGALELIVKAFNINYGLQQPLLSKCSELNDYSTLVGKVKEGIRQGLSHHDAIDRAVKFCLAQGLMKGYLEFNAEEVFQMLAVEWDMNDALQARFEDGEIHRAEKIANKLIRRGSSIEEIQELTELPLERIEKLAKVERES